MPSEYVENLSPPRSARSTVCNAADTCEAGTPAYRATTRRLSRPDRYG